MLHSKKLSSKKILLVDKSPKSGNDKTWCFWDKGNISSFWNDANIIHHEWTKLFVKANGKKDLLLDAGGYRYKMIRSADFYQYCFSEIKKAPNVSVVYGNVSGINSEMGIVSCDDVEYEGSYIFSSVLLQDPVLQENDIYLLQHFKGWLVETSTDFFDDRQADLMNFKTSQQHGCTFLYVLPVSKRKALIEYTLFTEDIIEEAEYDRGLNDFIINELRLREYHIAESEKGIIPMTNMHFPGQQGCVFFIGTAGGQTKASTGYTFSFIQKQTEQIVRSMEVNGKPVALKKPRRFNFYDTVLLRILYERKISGAEVFYDLFRKNRASKIFKFLDNETNLVEELQVMNTTSKRIFIPASMKSI